MLLVFSIDVEDNVMNVLETFPWHQITVDVLLAECRGTRLFNRCVAFLNRKGFRVLQ